MKDIPNDNNGSLESGSDFAVLAEKHIAGDLSGEDLVAFEALLDADSGLFDELAYRTLLHAHLTRSADADSAAHSRPQPVSSPIAHKHHLLWLAAGLCLVTFLAAVSLIWRQAGSRQAQHIATLVDTQNAHWGACDQPTREGSLLQPGVLDLKQGLCSIRFRSGAEIKLEAPAKLDLHDEMNVQLLAGTAVTHVPPAAIGFTIETPQGKIIDKGTEFLTSVDAEQGTTLTAVIDGEVQVTAKGASDPQPQSIYTGQQIVMDDTSDNQSLSPTSWSEFSLLPNREISQGDADDWIIFRTSDQGGRDGTAFQLNKDHHYRKELIMVKHTTGDAYSRIGYLGFDLRGVDMTRATKIELQLNAVPSGFGSAALSGDAAFTLWGVTSDHDDEWVEGLIPWEEAPGTIISPSQLTAGQARRLGSFSLKAGQSHARVVVSTDSLLDHCRKDGNRYITLAISCDSASQNPAGKVYAFEGALSPGGAEPELRVRF